MANKQVKNKKKVSNKKKQKTNKVFVVLSIVTLVVMGITVSIFAILNSKPLDSNSSNASIDSNITTPEEIKEKSMNVLVCGIDYEQGRDGKLTDVIMVVNLDIVSKKVNVLQIPRDTFIGYNYDETGKINSIYGNQLDGGIKGLSNTINKNFNITIDHYVTVTMESFRIIVDKLGGVEVYVPEEIPFEPGKYLPAGNQLLTGEQAEWLVRYRNGYIEGDIGRVRMQRYFWTGMAKKIITTPKTQMIGLVPTLSKEVESDMTVNQMISILSFLNGINLEDIRIEMLPGEATNNKYGYSVYSVHKKEVADLLNNYFRPHSEKISIEQLGAVELSNKEAYYNNTGTSLGEIDTTGKAEGGSTNNSNNNSNSSQSNGSSSVSDGPAPVKPKLNPTN